jgi:hypothetical protein
MKSSAGSVILNILGVFVAFVLSIVFIVTAFAMPLYYSVAGMLRPQTITTVLQHVDYVEVLKESKEVKQSMEELGIDVEVSNKIMQSEAVGEVLEDCAEKLTDLFSREDADLSEFNAAYLKGLVDEHLDGVLTAVETATGETIPKDELKDVINTALTEKADAIDDAVAELAPIKETVVTYSTATELVQTTLKWQTILVLALLEALLLGLIYVVRLKNYGGFVWLAVDTGIVGGLLGAVTLVVSSDLATSIVARAPGFMKGMLSAAMGSIRTALVIATAVCFGVMVLSIVACSLLRSHKRRRTAAINTKKG